jgi:hypothetical protein
MDFSIFSAKPQDGKGNMRSIVLSKNKFFLAGLGGLPGKGSLRIESGKRKREV